MDINVAGKDLRLLDIIDYCKSVIWHSCYCGVGDFDITVLANEKTLKLFVRGNFLYRKDSKTLMVVDKVELKTDVENGDYIIVTGKSAERLLQQRIIWSQTTLNGNVSQCVKSLVDENIVNTTISARKIQNLYIGSIATYDANVQKQLTGDELLDAVVEILSLYGIGFNISFLTDKNGGSMYFNIVLGKDRSDGNSQNNPKIVFSKEYDNVLNTDYTLDYSNYKNVALVAGEGEGVDRKTSQTGTAEGIERFEMYVDASDVSSNDGEITSSEYSKMLQQKGGETLAESAVVETYTGEIEPSTTYVFGRDFFLGDIVELENEYGISGKVRITEVTENFDENGQNILLSYVKA